MIDTGKYEGHLASEGQTWAWSKWMLKNAETIEQHEATSALLNDAPLLLAEVKRLRELLLTHDVCPTCGCYVDNDFSLDCCKTWGLSE